MSFFKNKQILFLTVLICLAVAVLPLLSVANAEAPKEETPLGGLEKTAEGAGLLKTAFEGKKLPEIIGMIIGVVLSFLGVILLVYMIYAGILWMTASGDAEQVKKAKDIIYNTLAGLIIIAAAYAITAFIMRTFVK